MEEFSTWLLRLSQFSALAGSLYFIFFIRSWKNISGIVFLLLLLSFLADNVNYFFYKLIYPNGFIIGNSWYILNYVVAIVFFKEILPKKKKIFYSFLVLFLIGTIVSFSSLYQFTESNVFIRLFSNLSFIIFSLLVYFELLKNPSKKITQLPLFWIVTGFFIHDSLVLLQSIFNNYLIFDLKISSEAHTWIYIIKLLANITKNFILFYAIVLIDKGYPHSLKPSKES